MAGEMKHRSYDEIASLGHFQKPDPDVLQRHIQEGLQAVEIAHAEQLQKITDCLSGGQSVLVECSKELLEYLVQCLTDNNADRHSKWLPAMKWLKVNYNGAQPTLPESVVSHLIRGMAEKMKTAFGAGPNHAVVMRHLDLMVWSAENRPRPELNDVVFWLAEFPSVVKLVFWDPIFPVPKVIGSLFPNRLSLQAFDRSTLWQLVTMDEAKRLSTDHLAFSISDQSRLYQYVSGTNVVELRRILRGLHKKFRLEHPSNLTLVYDYIRSQIGMAPMVQIGEVEGYKELKDQLMREVIFPINLRLDTEDDAALRQADSLVPRGVVLFGPPGTGKTEWAKWLAVELKIPLFVVHGPELKSKYVGETEAAIRQVFAQARRAAPSMILIDEIDSMTPTRTGGESHFEASMVAQFLSEMDGMRREESVIIVGTTNRIDAVDSAFLRPGRFSCQIEVGYPNANDRRAILGYYKRNYLLELTADSITTLVNATEGPIDGAYEKELRQYLQDYVKRELQTSVGPELEKQLGRSLGLDRAAACFSGDHLRAICLHLLRESLFRQPPIDVNDPGLLREAVEAVRRRRTSVQQQPVLTPLDWTSKHHR